MTWRRLLPFGAAGLLVAVMVATIASAGPNVVQDPKDTRGVLDVRIARFAHPKGEPPRWKVVTFEGWTPARIWDRGYVYVMLDTVGGEPPEYAAQIRSDGRRMHGVLFRLGKTAGQRDVAVTSLTVKKGNARSVSVRVPLKRLHFGPQRTFYRWWVVTTLSGDTCPSVCIDRAPNRGSVLRYRPGMSPTPTTTPPP